ncbi:hypothetical protein [uncultured Bradyrhizobium sp.]|uniref:hypothetical protein n=1 Tax=uncultured Bradyrhizobium sp. TaxID=199684 RepID=UPI00260EC53F|nr:hypothetical protein [uncultured Bradyrhizobium sp.]
MLRRIPAVKWAFTRLRPVPHDGSLDATPVAEDVSPVIAEESVAECIAAQDVVAPDITAQDTTAQETTAQDTTAERTELEGLAESAPTDISETSTVSVQDDAEIAAVAPSAQHDAAIAVIAESPPAAPTHAGVSEGSSREAPSDIAGVAEEETEVPAIEVAEIETAAEAVPDPATSINSVAEISAEVESPDAEPVDVVSEVIDAADLVVSNDPLPAEAGPVVTAEASPLPVEIERAPLDVPALVIVDDHSSDVIVDVEPAMIEPCVTPADAGVVAEAAPEDDLDNVPSPADAVIIEPAAVEIVAPVATVEAGSTNAASIVTDIAPATALVSLSPEVRSAPKVRTRPAEPADRAALIRQRWAESGIRMWNPRLHGTGEATLNIQGSVGLLPPEPGETMPRYDKLEFKLLGGQIVCEGVIVEPPAQASHRSFTRLAEPGKPERAREPARERRAALA